MGGKQLKPVGYQKGMHIEEKWTLTRRGAPYKSFREKTVTQPSRFGEDAPNTQTASGLDVPQAGTSPGMNKAPIPIAGGWADGGSMMTYSGMETRNVKHDDKDLITWMKGVRFGKRGPSSSDRRKSRKQSMLVDIHGVSAESMSENLSDEIIHVGDIFTKVTFEEADVVTRHVRVSFNGPWGPEGKLVFMRLRMDFPVDYPESFCPHFELDRTSSLPEERVDDLENDLGTIATGYLIHRRGCIEAILSYLLGERDLHESTDWLKPLSDVAMEEQAESSSDDEDGLMGDYPTTGSQNLDMEGSMGSGILSANANVPLPKACGAIWAADGRLVCFFPPKEEPQSILHHAALADSSRVRDGREIFEGFGRLHTDSPDLKLKSKSSIEDGEESGSDDTSSSSSSSSSSDSGGPDMIGNPFQPPAAWHGALSRFQKPKTQSTNGSVPTSTALNKKVTYSKTRTVVSIKVVDDVLPSKRSLAEEYSIFGDAQSLCSHASDVASNHGNADLANVWELVRLVLRDDIPLRALSLPSPGDDIYVLAQRALVQIKRKDSGLDLFFDEPEAVSNPKQSGHVKWGNHPFSMSWLVQALFDYFERIADVQMLAMLSCVFAQAIPGGEDETLASKSFYQHLPKSMTLPAQSVGYFPSEEVAIGVYEPIISLSISPKHAQPSGTAFGSTPSSNGFRDGEQLIGEPVTPFSTGGNSPPLPLSRGSTFRSSTEQSLSTSPDQHRTSIPSATSSFAASVWTRPFNLASSPPIRNRLSGDDLSSSTPSNNVTWGKSTKSVFKSDSTIRKSYISQGPGDNYDDGSSTEEDEPVYLQIPVKISLKNQNMFDDEACVSVPFLKPEDAPKYAYYREAYAEMLGSWDLTIQQNELRKYNGIVSGNPPKRADRDSQSTLTLGGTDPMDVVEDGLGPLMVRCRTSCSRVDQDGHRHKPDARCSHCGVGSKLLACNICYQPIAGIYKVCLGCGHAAHMSCLQPLLLSLLDEKFGCETGCGCECDEKIVMEGPRAFDFDSKPESEQRMSRTTEFGALHEPQHSTIINRRGSLAESRRAKAFGDQHDQDDSRGSRPNIRRTRTRSFGH